MHTHVKLFKLKNEQHILLLTMHHIVFDGWSQGILSQELATLYKAFSEGKSSSLPDLRIQYGDFDIILIEPELQHYAVRAQ